MSKTQNKGYILIALSIAIFLMVAMVFACLWTSDKVYADYEDLDPNSIVNFNQLYQNGNFISVSNWSLYGGVSSYTVSNNECTYLSSGAGAIFQDIYPSVNDYVYIKIFIKSDSLTDRIGLTLQGMTSATVWCQETTDYQLIEYYGQVSTGSFLRCMIRDYRTSGNDYVHIKNCTSYNLTQMFGSDYIPTFEECRGIFTADYYSYNTGTPMTFNSVFYDYDNMVINFNQLLNMTQLPTSTINDLSIVNNAGILDISGTSSSSQVYSIQYSIDKVNIIEGHKYYSPYILGTNDISLYLDDTQNGSHQCLFFRDSGEVTTATASGECYVWFWVNSNITVNASDVSTYLVDLTVCFGEGLEPNAQQCHEYFTSIYYPYNLGTTINLGGLDSYAQGYEAAVNNLTSNTFYEQMTPTNFTKYFESSTVMDNASNTVYSGIVYPAGNNWMTLGYNTNYNPVDYTDNYSCGYLPLFNPIEANTRVRITCNCAANFGAGSTTNNYFSLFIFYNGVFTKLIDSPIITATQWIGDGAVGYNMEFEFVSPYAIEGIYIVPKRTSFEYYFGNFTLSRQVLDYYAFLDSQFAAGEAHAKEYYENAYAEGGLLYQQIFNVGKAAGVEQANQYTFFTLMSSVIEAPLNAILGIFNFELLGYNLKNLFTFLLTLCVIVTIVRLIWGNA